jgi:hypothetical protein
MKQGDHTGVCVALSLQLIFDRPAGSLGTKTEGQWVGKLSSWWTDSVKEALTMSDQ